MVVRLLLLFAAALSVSFRQSQDNGRIELQSSPLSHLP